MAADVNNNNNYVKDRLMIHIDSFKTIKAKSDSSKSGKVFVSNFTIDRKERRKSAGVTEFQTNTENSGGGCHSFSEEIEIVRWLHQNKKIDASLCLLNDTSEISVNETDEGLEISGFINDLIKNT